MDDNSRLKVEFPVGHLLVTVAEPTPEQMFVLALSRQPKSDVEQYRLVTRLTQIMEKLTGDQWYDVIETGLINEELTVSQLMDLVGDVLQFEWAKHSPDPETTAAEYERDTADAPAKRPAPRVVGRG